MSAEAAPPTEAIVAALIDADRAVSPSDFPPSDVDVDLPGLYSWWADEGGRSLLGRQLDTTLPDLIYAGQAGADSGRRARPNTATLRSRIRGNHIGGNIGSSTFRLTLAALLQEPLGLTVQKRGRLETSSNRQLTEWIHEHLRVAVCPYADRLTLPAIEHELLRALDPPLNLMGLPATAARSRLSSLRSALKTQDPEGGTPR